MTAQTHQHLDLKPRVLPDAAAEGHLAPHTELHAPLSLAELAAAVKRMCRVDADEVATYGGSTVLAKLLKRVLRARTPFHTRF